MKKYKMTKETNLSHEGDYWVYESEEVYGNAIVCEHAKVYGNAVVCEHAKVYADAKILDDI